MAVAAKGAKDSSNSTLRKTGTSLEIIGTLYTGGTAYKTGWKRWYDARH